MRPLYFRSAPQTRVSETDLTGLGWQAPLLLYVIASPNPSSEFIHFFDAELEPLLIFVACGGQKKTDSLRGSALFSDDLTKIAFRHTNMENSSRFRCDDFQHYSFRLINQRLKQGQKDRLQLLDPIAFTAQNPSRNRANNRVQPQFEGAPTSRNHELLGRIHPIIIFDFGIEITVDSSDGYCYC